MRRTSIIRRLAGGGLALALGLTACATSTPYQPLGSGQASGGYTEVRLAPDRYRVTFSGNNLTSRDKVEGYLLYRAAEITVQQGYDWFDVVRREVDHDVRTQLELDPLYRPWYGPAYASWMPYWRYYGPRSGWMTWYPYRGDPFWASHVDARTVERFEATAEIEMHRGAAPPSDHKTFDARRALADLGPNIHRP